MYTLNCKGKLLVIDQPLVMGIINATPDSFYKSHLQTGLAGIVSLAGKMIREGAAIFDIGGQSTRPGSERIAALAETERVLPVIEAIKSSYPEIILSIDTYHAGVAEKAVNAGASIVNDISGGTLDREMIATVAGLKVPYICMHMKGTPESMQKNPVYDDVVKEVLDYFIIKINECKQAGIHDVIIDPGFGFGKTIAHNFQLLKHLAVFKMLEKPVLAGLSRKSTVYKTLGITMEEALNGTTVLNTIALMHGACVLRVHDVKEAKEAVGLLAACEKAQQ
ncbi:MAG: dihydropteroate synthase [Ferruginibacter sp.]|nr:dihydropteroate synthase [Ferruginibacter sp.]